MAAWKSIPFVTLFSPEKSFNDRWVGSPGLNRMGVHLARMKLANRCAQRRVRRAGDGPAPDVLRRLLSDGVAVVPNIVPEELFSAMQAEAQQGLAAIEAQRPAQHGQQPGFGDREYFDGGFDRYDGSTLNRFVHPVPQRFPAIASYLRSSAWQDLLSALQARRYDPANTDLYLTMHGAHEAVADPQKDLHRDTFYRSLKFWLFLEDVRAEDGPFCYAPGSHKLTESRLAWEQAEAIRRATGQGRTKGGAFRIGEGDLKGLDCAPMQSYPVAANTLVVADTLGFHARGHAGAGARRLALYGYSRPYPFSLF